MRPLNDFEKKEEAVEYYIVECGIAPQDARYYVDLHWEQTRSM